MSTLLTEPAALVTPPQQGIRTIADLLERLGGIPASRVRFRPSPGQATVADVAADKCCELIEGTLVEKAMGVKESLLALAIGDLLRALVLPKNLGIVIAADGPLELATRLVRLPDAAFLSWDRLPGGQIPDDPVPAVVPDLAVEVLSEGNTAAEMARKRGEYFGAGVRLVWIVDRFSRTVVVYTKANQFQTLTESDTLDGGDVLPDFSVPVRELFAELDRRRSPSP